MFERRYRSFLPKSSTQYAFLCVLRVVFTRVRELKERILSSNVRVISYFADVLKKNPGTYRGFLLCLALTRYRLLYLLIILSRLLLLETL